MLFSNIRKACERGLRQSAVMGWGKNRKASHKSRASGSKIGSSSNLVIEPLEQRALLSVASGQFALPPQHDLMNSQGFLTGPSTAAPLQIATSYLRANAASLGLTSSDFDHTIVTNQYTDSDTGTTHIYLRQEYNGYEVQNANLAVNITAKGEVINVGGGFVPGLNSGSSNTAMLSSLASSQNFVGPMMSLAYFATSPTLSAIAALDQAAPALGLTTTITTTTATTVAGDGTSQSITLMNSGYSLDSIPVRLQYIPTADGRVTLAWDYVLRTPDGDHWYDLSVDSVGGTISTVFDWVDHATYNVYPRPVETPDDGSRTVLTDPADPAASPYGWHDTNGTPGPEYTITRGNNVYAYEDRRSTDTPGYSPDGGSALNFNYPLDLTKSPLVNQDAAITNLFYWNNLIHDIHYKYGFTEAAGNFQEDNYTGQGLGNDAVQAEAQDGSGVDNANFATPPDGQSGRMQMYIWDMTTPQRDGDFDSVIMTHEYGHGVSNRLVGGPANADALDAVQSAGMGEGWSDFWGLMFTEKTILTRTTQRTVGTYVQGESPTDAGIRRHPYCFDMKVNPLTYGDIIINSESHDEGEVWCQTLWDMTVLLEEKYGFDKDITKGYSQGSAGNILALKLVMDSLKLMPSNPTFLNSRDAILQADQILNGGKDAYQIWTAFARRGMGVSAKDGGDSNSTNVTEAFDMPNLSPDLTITKTHIGSFLPGDTADKYTITVSNIGLGPTTGGTVSVTDILPDGLTATAMSGDGWVVDMGNLTAGRVDVLSAGDSFPPLTVTVSVATDAPSSVVNTAYVYYDGDSNVNNNVATDLTSIGLLTISSTTPDLSGGTLNAGTSQIQLHFSSVSLKGDDSTNYQLQTPGPDGLLGTADDVNVPFTLSFADNTATLTVSPLPENLYRLTVLDNITDTAGVRLDGNRDGLPGGNWTDDFVVVPSSDLLSSTVTFPSYGSNPTSVAVGDFNGDGFKDLAVVNNPYDGLAPSIKIFMNDGKGNFTPGISITSGLSNPSAVVVDDFNGDHKDDLAVANYGNNTVEVFRGDGHGGFVLTSTTTVGAHPINLVTGDFNGDGKKDIAVANYGDTISSPAIPGTLGILTGTGTGSFTYSSVSIGTNKEPRALAVADFNGDAKLDLAMTSYYNNNVVIFKGDGTGKFTIQTTKSTGGIGPRSIAAGDVNGDGKIDLVIGNYVSSNVSVLLGNGAGGLSDATLFYTGSDNTLPLAATNPRNVAIADFNGDGKADIIVTNSTTSDVGILLGNGSGGFGQTLTYPTDNLYSPFGLAVADFNGDNRPDVAVTNTGSPTSTDSVSLFYDYFGTPAVTLKTPQNDAFDVSIGRFGQGQFIQGTNNAFDGFGRLSVGGSAFQPATANYTTADSGQTVITGSATAAGLNVTRRITVPKTGADDFARTTDVFTNPTNTDITTTVQIVGNLGSDAATSIFATSSGDATLTTGDLWFATSGGKGQTLLHFLHGYAGLAPSSVKLVGDNIVWTYNITVPAFKTQELAYFTIILDDKNITQAAAEQKANALVAPSGFLGQAGLGLNASDLSQLTNFVFGVASQPMTIVPGDWDRAGSAGLTLKRTSEGMVHVYQTGTQIDIVPPRSYSSIASLSITGRDIIDDELTIDLTGGNPVPAGGVNFDGGTGGGNALLLVAGTGDDSATMTAAQITNNSIVLANYVNVAHFGFSLGSGSNSLLLDHVTLNLDRDNAISNGTNVTVNGGSLNFHEHPTALGNLVLNDGAQVEATNINNSTTTVTSGSLTAGSIDTDSLTIGPTGPIPILPDRYEENDNKAIVDSRPEGGTNSPNLGLINSQRIITGLTMEDSADWFKFRTDATGSSTDFVRIDFTNSQGNLDLVVYAADGTTVVGSSTGTGDSEIVSLSGLPAGYYYVKVYGYHGATNPGYTLTFFPLTSDRYEPNNSQAIVDASPEGGTNSPNLGTITAGQTISNLTMDDAADWYKFKMAATGTAADVVRIDFLNSHGNLDLVVYAADGTTVVGSSTGTGDSEIVNLNGLQAGYYYVKVYGYQGATNTNYTLSIAPIPSDVYEDNDTKAIVDASLEGIQNSPNLGLIKTTRIITGLTMNDSADWYKFWMDSAGTGADSVRIDFANSLGNLDMVVYAADGTTVVGSSTGTGNSEIVSLSGAPAGYYYVKVYGYQAATNPNYTLTFFPLVPDRYEKNDSKAMVDALPEGGTNSPNLGPITSELTITGLSMDDAADWFKFKLTAAGTTNDFVRIDFAQSQGDLDMVVYAADGTTVWGSSTGKGDSEIVSLNGAPAGYYYVKVYGYLGAFNPKYSLTIMPISPDAYEPNNTPSIVDARPAGGTNSPNLGTLDSMANFKTTIAGLTMDDSADWYKFTMPTNGTPVDWLRIDFKNSQGNLDLELYDADGTTLLASSTGLGDGEVISLNGLLAGTYYIKVYGYLGATNPNYSLTIYSVEPDRFEPNDTANTATDLGIIKQEKVVPYLTVHQGDVDWYKFHFGDDSFPKDYGLPNDMVLFYSPTFGFGNLDMALYRSDGTTLVGTSADTGIYANTEAVSMKGLTVGDYYLKVTGNQGATNKYSLWFLHIFPDAYEENDTNTAVDKAPPGGKNSPNLGELTTKLVIKDLTMEDGADWFRFTTKFKCAHDDTTNYVQIDFPNSRGDLDMRVYKSDGTLWGISQGNTNTEFISLKDAEAGTYYVVVYGYQGASNPDYTLTISAPSKDPPAGLLAASSEVLLPTSALSNLASALVSNLAAQGSINTPSNPFAFEVLAAPKPYDISASKNIGSTTLSSDASSMSAVLSGGVHSTAKVASKATRLFETENLDLLWGDLPLDQMITTRKPASENQLHDAVFIDLELLKTV